MAPVALVTGGGRGIGKATVQLLAERGYDVCINYVRDADSADALAGELLAMGRRAVTVQADVAREADVERLFATLDAEFGSLAALVNNAGVLFTQMRVADMDAARIDRVLAVNVTGSLLCCREAVRRMSTEHGGNGGSIVNVSSMAARLGAPNEYVDYAAAKGAVDSLTIGLAREVASQGIRVNAVRPGLIRTDIHTDGGVPDRVDRLGPQVPIGRGGEAVEVARAIVWLLSDEASFVTGSLLDVSGGR
ncbi:MAG: SDR family oxidoreductase [Woeseiaceae bacterium]|nr:SDR family oxidoreductase [Woeseiaceae bacterium]